MAALEPIGASMSAEPLQRLRMSYDEWWDLPPRPRAEWVDGEVVVSAAPSYRHQEIAFRLNVLLDKTLPHLHVVQGVGVQLPRNRVRIPDVVALAGRPDGVLVEEPPVLVVEVLSPSTRGEDMMRKSPEYAEAGISQYWIVDPEAESVAVYGNSGGGWESLAIVDRSQQNATVEVGAHGTVALDLREILTD